MRRQCYRLEAGSRDRLTPTTETLAAPAAGEIQVTVRAIGLNFADVFSVWGLYSATPEGAFVPGLEFSGEVVALGAGVETHAVGDEVYGVTRFGAYATALNIDARYAFPLPQNWQHAEAAAYPVQALTAYYGLRSLGNLQPGHTVLVHSAAGGVGVWAGRICRHYGAMAVGTVGRRDKVAFAKTEGYAEVLVRGDLNRLKGRLRDAGRYVRGETVLSGDGAFGPLATATAVASSEPVYDLVMEPTGGRVLADSFALLRPEGRMIVYGSAHFASPAATPNKLRLLYKYLRRPRLDPQAMIAENKGVLAFNLIWLYEQTEKMTRLLGELDALQLGRPYVGERFGFGELPMAVAALQGGGTVGKVVVEV